MIKELVDRPSSIAPQFTKVTWVVFVHFFGETDIVVAANTSSLVLTEHYWSLIFSYDLVALTEPALIPFEVYEGMLIDIQGSVDGSPAFFLIKPNLVHEGVHVYVVADCCWSLFIDHFLHFLFFHLCIFLFFRVLFPLFPFLLFHLLLFFLF